jgi:hypothetical protein
MLRLAALVLFLSISSALRADPATVPYAGTQLRIAEETLARASAALAMHDYAKALQLAAQASLDARLAWSMSDSPTLRRAAAEVNQRAERLRSRGLIAGGSPPSPKL